jgi:hypothetical protein
LIEKGLNKAPIASVGKRVVLDNINEVLRVYYEGKYELRISYIKPYSPITV